MAGDATIANAYVQIIPSMEGVSASIQKGLDSENVGIQSGRTLGSALSKGLTTTTALAGAGLAASTVAVTSFAKSSIEAGMDFDKAMSQVAATGGKTMDELEADVRTTSTAYGDFTGNLREYAQFMGSNTAFSASEAAEALNYLALAGYNTQKSMDMLPSVLNLAAAGGIDLAYASDMVTDASSALGLTMDETYELIDKMAAASSNSNTSVAQLGEAILTVGGTAKNLAGGTTELSTALGILADNGIKGAEGGTALRNIILSLSAPTDKAAILMEQLGLEVFDAEGNMRPLNETFGDLNTILSGMSQSEQIEVLDTLFNKVDLKSANALLANSCERFDELSLAIDGSWYSVSSLSEQLSNIGVDLSAAQSDLSNLGISSEELSEALSSCSGNASALIDQLVTSADEGTTYDDVLGVLGNSLDELQSAFDNTAGASQAMADTQLDNLAGDVTLFQSALESAKITISDELSPALRSFVQEGTTLVSELTAGFKEDGLQGALEVVTSHLGDLGTTVGSALADINWEDLNADLAEGIQSFFDGIQDTDFDFATFATGLLTAIGSALNAIVDGGMDLITGGQWSDWIDSISDEGGNINFEAFAQSIFDGIGSAFSSLITDGLNFITGGNWDTWKSDLESFEFPDIGSAVGSIWEGISTDAATQWATITSDLDTAWTSIRTNAETIFSDAGAAVDSFVDDAQKKFDDWGIDVDVQTTWDNLKGFIDDPIGKLSTSVASFITNVSSSFTDWGIDTTVNTIWTSLQSFIDDPIGAVGPNVATFISDVKTSFDNWGIDSDGVKTLFNNIGSYISGPLGVAKGLLIGESGYLTKIVAKMNEMGIDTTGIESIFDNIGSFISSPIETAQAAVESAIGLIEGTINGIIEWWNNGIGGFFSGISDAIASANAGGYSLSGETGSWEVYPTEHAIGGIFNQPHLGIVAEAGAEAVIPLENYQYMKPFAEAIAANLNSNEYIEPVIYNLNFGGMNVNDNDSVRNVTRDYIKELIRLGAI